MTQSLLEKAHAFEARNRMDLAAQTWQQVLLAEPKNTEALAGLARAAKLAGNTPLAETYLDRLRAISPRDPNIARVQTMMSQQGRTEQLTQAAKFSELGQYAQAMEIYRQVFGDVPPPGDWSLAYYETESATDDGRAHAIAGLRALVEKYPADSRYQIALGRILTYNPKTREEGRRLLERHPDDPHAVEALRQSLLWDSQNPASAAEIRAYLMKHKDVQLATALRNQPKRGAGYAPRTPEEIAAAARDRAQSAQLAAAYKALNSRHIEEAEKRFKEILANEPHSGRALAGMGYVRMQQSNFGGAISFLEQAQEDGAHDAGVAKALDDARFYYTMSEGAVALNENDLTTAEKQYQAALTMRPASPEALEGLGGTLMKAQQPEFAVQVYERYVKLKPGVPDGWRGLFMAKYGAGNAAGALVTERAIPPAIHAQLMRDPEFLRTLASAYSAVGRDADAQRVLRSALDLPFPAGARGVKVETQLQYAGLLQQANHLDQAAGLYRQALTADPANASAWEGLVRVQHAMKQDAQALQTLQTMPATVFSVAMRDPGFETTVASIYQSQNRLDVAQSILEKAVAQETEAGMKPSLAVETQLAGIYLAQNNTRQAYPLYRQILSENPQLTDAWKGLLATLHTSGRDQEALAEIQQIPPDVRRTLENDVAYLQTVAAVYSALGQPQESMVFLTRVEQHYAAEHATAPADIDIQNAYLLFNGGNDVGLYRQLMILGGRQDLTDEQRRTVQTIWSLWASRRANQAAAAGNNKRALAILNAAARAFPDNPAVLKALASGYARAGQPKQAVLIFKSQDMTMASAADYKAAIGSALAANDMKSAELWLRYGLEQYPKDAQMLILGAKFEQARGDNNRAAEYYKASLAAMPPPDPGAELAAELSRPMPMTGNRLPSATQAQDLASLLGPGAPSDNGAVVDSYDSTAAARPYLPSYTNSYGQAPVDMSGNNYPNGSLPNNNATGQPVYTPQGIAPQSYPGSAYPAQSYGSAVPSYMTNPVQQNQSYPAQRNQSKQPAGSTLKDYVPPQVEQPTGGYTVPQQMPLPGNPQNRSALPPARTTQSNASGPDEQAYQRQQIQRLTRQAQGSYTGAGPLTLQPSGSPAPSEQKQEVYGAYVPYVPPQQRSTYTPSPVPVQLGDATPHSVPPQRGVTDVLPQARYMPNATGKRSKASAPTDVAPPQSTGAPHRQPNPNLGMTGQSNPPQEEIASPPTQTAQYVVPTPPADQVPQPAPAGANQPFDSPGQQYPQPYSVKPKAKAVRKRPVAPVQQAPSIADQPGMLYPGVAQPLNYQPYPMVGPPAPQGVPPTDAELMARLVPPLRGGNYDPNAPGPPLTLREQTELDLATLEGSYSGWLGGTAYARYRSGTVGFDRLTDLEASFEASVVAAKTARFTVVARPVFLSSGTIDSAALQAQTGGVIPVLGTLPGNALVTPPQQNASGIGGELQMTTANLGLAVGYTPYEFLVSNITARGTWRPGGGHFSLFGDRDSVKETELSYAGLRDPGSATRFFPGNIWGGVVSTGGGARFDLGNELAGFYISADGASLTGYHVLDNTKFEGTAGAYFRAKVYPEYGSLNVGATIFGMHYSHDELGLTYGQGGYFSPQAYFLAAVPVSFTGHYKRDFHYVVAGSVGVQTFQTDSAPYYPLDRGTQTDSGNPYYPAFSNTGFNYSINSEGSYRIADHWYAGGFVAGNNTNNYNTISGGFFLRYLFKPQYPNEGYPTGLFPIEGFRPLRVP
jgi:tetratricopeptide (TPR) repeat protein